MNTTKLRTGFTTGTCATAGATAGMLAILGQKQVKSVDVMLPKGSTITIKIKSCEFGNNWSKCSVIKDGGDDPDVTHGAEIITDVKLIDKPNTIEIDGGEGVGIVTKPGLGLELNKPAINPIPKKMICDNIQRVAKSVLVNKGVKIIISVPRGKELGPKTDNPRLGIVGGISILGTSGIVIPFSTASFAASIRQNIDVAIAMGEQEIVLTTGGRSEDFAKKVFDLPEHCFVQMGDFAGYSTKQCAKKGIQKITVVGFIGKLAKMASGVKQTHVKGSKVDMNFLANLAKKLNAPQIIVEKIKQANTARHVLEIVKENNIAGFFDKITSEVSYHMQKHVENKIPINVIMFDFDGSILSWHKSE